MAEYGGNSLDPLEVEAVLAEAEIRLGETRGQNTIIEVISPNIASRSTSLLTFTQAQPPPYEVESPQRQTILDSIFSILQSVIDGIFSSKGDDCPCSILEPEELDTLALYQGENVDMVARDYMNNNSCFDDALFKRKVAVYRMLMKDENHTEWERRCKQLLTLPTLLSHILRELETYRAKLRCYLGSWNQERGHCSPSIYLLDDQLTAHRIPCVNQTDSIRGKLGVEEGIHAWDMRISGPVGTHCSVGISTRDAKVATRSGYISLVGDDEHSWGWDIVWGNLSHEGKIMGKYPNKIAYEYTPGDAIRIILDCDEGILSFAVNEMYFGIAFAHLPVNTSFYPTISLVYGNCEVSLLYLGKPPLLRNSY